LTSVESRYQSPSREESYISPICEENPEMAARLSPSDLENKESPIHIAKKQ
jgi:hypothetical protein